MSWSTGNWGETDYPDASTFPPYGNTNWLKVNRDYTASITQQNVADVFANGAYMHAQTHKH